MRLATLPAQATDPECDQPSGSQTEGNEEGNQEPTGQPARAARAKLAQESPQPLTPTADSWQAGGRGDPRVEPCLVDRSRFRERLGTRREERLGMIAQVER